MSILLLLSRSTECDSQTILCRLAFGRHVIPEICWVTSWFIPFTCYPLAEKYSLFTIHTQPFASHSTVKSRIVQLDLLMCNKHWFNVIYWAFNSPPHECSPLMLWRSTWSGSSQFINTFWKIPTEIRIFWISHDHNIQCEIPLRFVFIKAKVTSEVVVDVRFTSPSPEPLPTHDIHC
jgi:hypothetical protein